MAFQTEGNCHYNINMNKIMDNSSNSQPEGKIKDGKAAIKIKLKMKFKGGIPKEGLDLLGIAKKLSERKFGKK